MSTQNVTGNVDTASAIKDLFTQKMVKAGASESDATFLWTQRGYHKQVPDYVCDFRETNRQKWVDRSSSIIGTPIPLGMGKYLDLTFGELADAGMLYANNEGKVWVDIGRTFERGNPTAPPELLSNRTAQSTKIVKRDGKFYLVGKTAVVGKLLTKMARKHVPVDLGWTLSQQADEASVFDGGKYGCVNCHFEGLETKFIHGECPECGSKKIEMS